ncbi:MAG: class I SAM-dependent methyltransferase [Polyangiaceae bacterium]|nr:class I SAM-dependent methyltransferase [Polyangiaceae bacterium]
MLQHKHPSAEKVETIRSYYDAFAKGYEAKRRPANPDGYHALIDDLEIDAVRRFGGGKDVLECGVGTGLLLDRISMFAKSAKGIDLSPGMLEKARARGLDVIEGSVTALPFPDESFDVTYSFKVLAHVPEIGLALSEMARVTRRGGVVLAEFYNPYSLRGLAKRFGPAKKISEGFDDQSVYTRLDAPWNIPKVLPPTLTLETTIGVRVVTPFAGAIDLPGVGWVLEKMERSLTNVPSAAMAAGFFVAVLRKAS